MVNVFLIILMRASD